jgi:hypothetical protein
MSLTPLTLLRLVTVEAVEELVLAASPFPNVCCSGSGFRGDVVGLIWLQFSGDDQIHRGYLEDDADA